MRIFFYFYFLYIIHKNMNKSVQKYFISKILRPWSPDLLVVMAGGGWSQYQQVGGGGGVIMQSCLTM